MINDATLALIKSFESCKLTAYLDSVKVPTIGWGHVRGVKMGQTITQQQADQFLRDDLASAEHDVDRIVFGAPLTENERGALVSFTYNAGAGNLQKLIKDGLDKVPARMPLFNRAGGKVLRGLTRRRQAEAALFRLKG